MNIETIAEHSIDLDLLPEKANILDCGCRGMLFTNHLRSLGHNVIAIDIDNLPDKDYLQIAIGKECGKVGIKRSADPQATMMCAGNEVSCVSIQQLCKDFEIDFFDVIKLDIEGGELEVIMSMDRPYAKQVSIEMHIHTGIYGLHEANLIASKLISLGYIPIKHKLTKMHGLSENFWDSLFILK